MKKIVSSFSMLSSSICNLNCSYCYIPKDIDIKKQHDSINKSIIEGSLIKYLTDNYVIEKVESIGFWGAEPTLNVDNLSIFLSDLIKISNLKEVVIPSNFTTNPENLLTLIKNIVSFDKKIYIKAQVSLDGPHYITDVTRGEGTTKKIIDNLNYILDKLNKIDLKENTVEIFSKTTWNSDTILYLDSHPEKIEEVGLFFKTTNDYLRSVNTNKNIVVNITGSGNMCLPGDFTIEDGNRLTRVLKILADKDLPIGALDNMSINFKRLVESKNRFSRSDFGTCGAIKGTKAIGNNFSYHICQRTFMSKLNKEDKFSDWIIDDPYNLDYTVLSYHYFSSLTINLTINTIFELVRNGQILKKYLDKKNAYLLAMFINSCIACPAENFMENLNFHSNTVSSIRLLGNGALDVVSEYYFKKEDKWKKLVN